VTYIDAVALSTALRRNTPRGRLEQLYEEASRFIWDAMRARVNGIQGYPANLWGAIENGYQASQREIHKALFILESAVEEGKNIIFDNLIKETKALSLDSVNLDNALKRAEEVWKDNTIVDYSTIYGVTQGILNAISNKSKLVDLLVDANAKIARISGLIGLDDDALPTFTTLSAAMGTATTVRDNIFALQSVVDAEVVKLEAALAVAQAFLDTLEPAHDKSILEAALKEAEEVFDELSTVPTMQYLWVFSRLIPAIDAGEKVLADPLATQKQVDRLVSELEEAIALGTLAIAFGTLAALIDEAISVAFGFAMGGNMPAFLELNGAITVAIPVRDRGTAATLVDLNKAIADLNKAIDEANGVSISGAQGIIGSSFIIEDDSIADDGEKTEQKDNEKIDDEIEEDDEDDNDDTEESEKIEDCDETGEPEDDEIEEAA
jgi:hypothetical protein